MNSYSFIIIGNGPLGVGLALRLSQCGFQPIFLGRSGPTSLVANIQSEGDGPTLHLTFEKPTREQVATARAVFVAVKAYHLEAALEQHVGYLPPRIPIISVGNGAVEKVLMNFSERHERWPVRLGITTLAVSRLGNESFALRSVNDRIQWGPLSPPLDPPTAAEALLLQRGKPFFHWYEDPFPLYRKKWLFNSVLNSLAATRRASSNGELLADKLNLQCVFAEAYALGTMHWGPWDEPAEIVFEELVDLIRKTEANENSMARDIRLGRETETKFLAGLAERYDGFPLLKSLHRELTDLNH
jgi:ketopantoate reductase